MGWVGIVWTLLLASGALAWILRERWMLATSLGVAGTVSACVVGLAAVIPALLDSTPRAALLPWSLPLGIGAIGLDSLSAWFIVVLLPVSGVAAVYGAWYLRPEEAHRRTAGTWLPFNILIASMVGVTVARDGMVFLLAWEAMTLASFALVVFDHDQAQVRSAGFLYLVAAHVGTACLLVLFLLLDDGSGTMTFGTPGVRSASHLAFTLALLGFGMKAGFFPLHVWLPEAHSSAPTHVSAVMSGVMLKMGIYGLIRTVGLFDQPPMVWGVTLVAVGLASGILGVLMALAQHDLKRLLAYHSVENLGIIALGLGISWIGKAADLQAVAWLGMAGALMHVLNHALFKSLLFLGAGAVARSTGTRRIDHMGGLIRRIPQVGWLFLLGAVAIAGLPPLNGFVSEVLVFAGAFQGVTDGARELVRLPALAVVAGLALIGGLAAACFAKVVGIVFLGEPRTLAASQAVPVSRGLWIPMGILAGLCLVVGIVPAGAVFMVAPAVSQALGMEPGDAIALVREVPTRMLVFVGYAGGALLLTVGVVAGLRRLMGRRHRDRNAVTWDCGYVAPTSRMQYTASSFARPLLEDLSPILGIRVDRDGPDGLFPPPGRLAVHGRDPVLTDIINPVSGLAARAMSACRVFQRGNVQTYLLYVLLALVALLIAWKEF
jgi:hydrogenase-4 component B